MIKPPLERQPQSCKKFA